MVLVTEIHINAIVDDHIYSLTESQASVYFLINASRMILLSDKVPYYLGLYRKF